MHARTHARLAENTPLSAFLIALAVLTLAPAAHAQITTPAPALHQFSVPGVFNAGGTATYFSCTSTTATPQDVTVEVFGQNGAPAGSGTKTALGNGASVTFGTQTSGGFNVDVNLGSGCFLWVERAYRRR